MPSPKPSGGVAAINAKRHRVSPGVLRSRAEAGEDISDKRAVVRLGKQNTRIITGQEDLSVWSKEELERGQRKDRNGRWQGKAPLVVPKAIHDELVKRTLSEAQELMRSNLTAAVEALVDIAKGEDVEEKDRLKAIGMIMDRVMGKTPEKIELSAEKPKWVEALEGAIVPLAPDEEEPIDVTFQETD